MKAAVLFKIASVLLLLFAAGHTFGFLSFKPPSVESRAVYESMNNVHFQVRGSSFSYGGFYRGFGLSITVNMLFLAFLSWYLGALASSNPKVSATLGWALCALQVVSVGMSWIYFSAVPATLSAIAAVCLGWAAYAAT
jgi:hypothetical protein